MAAGSSSLTSEPRATSADIAQDAARYLTFTLNGEAYALDIFHVTEILEYRHLTVVPMMPDFIRGVINLRGRVVPVIDLAIRFARGTTTIARRTSIIIVHISEPPSDRATDAGQDIGILVDAVNNVARLGREDIEPAPAFGAGIRADYIAGMAKTENDFMIVLAIDHVLSLNDMVSLHASAGESVGTANGGGDAGRLEAVASTP